jgi:hypothetical protein
VILMRLRKLAAIAASLVLFSGFAHAQTTGEIYGKATDKSGAVVPGVTVTLSGPTLLQPQVAATSSTGTYRFPGVPIGTYTVKFELAGFSSISRPGVQVTIGQNAQINGTLEVSSQQEVIEVTAEAPLIDLRSNVRATNFTQEALQNIPSARDPWVIMQQSAGIAMDRENVGGNMSGQQSGFVARGAAGGQVKWNLDGVDITDMNALASPIYYDFDAFQEMQMSTGGADVTMQTPGVGINLVTKGGTDKFRGTARFYITDDSVESVNVTDEQRAQGASSGNPIQNIKDYGAEMGGPIIKGKLWAWGSYGTQDIKVGVNGFYLRTPECAPVKAAPLNFEIKEVWECLSTDLTTLNTYNVKLNYQMTGKTHVSLFFNAAEKVRNARDASDLRPEETTYRQKAVTDPALGSSMWKTGIPKTYKASVRHIFSDRFSMELQYAHVGNNFVLDFHEDALKDVQPAQEIASGLWSRSFQASSFVRPTDAFDLTGTRSSSGFLGGDHALKFGVRYRTDQAVTLNHRGGNVEARFRSPGNNFTTASEANMYRDQFTDYSLASTSFYLQDTFTKNKFTVMAGLRYDRQWDKANASSVPAHPFFGQATITGAIFNHLPAINFAGADAGVTFSDLAPRLGVNYDLKGDGRSVLKLNLARYVNQLGSGDIASTLNPIGASFVRYPWTDLNGDKFVSANEINITGTALSFGGNYNPATPTALTVANSVDSNLTEAKTNEVILAFDQQIGNSFAFGISGIYRKYTNFRWNDVNNWSDANYVLAPFTAAPSTCPAAQQAQCPTVNVYNPTSAVPAPYTYTNRPGFYREYKGLELTARKRASNGLTLSGSLTWQSTPEFYPKGSYEDPSNIENLDGAQYAPVSAGSGIDNIYTNATWLGRLTAAYIIPWQQIGVSMFWNGRSGYAVPFAVQSLARPNGGGTATIFLNPLGEDRLPAYHNIDFRVDKTVKIVKSSRIIFSAEVFNLLNNNTVQSQRRIQNAANANLISSMTAPRVMRFGARLSW